MTAGFSLRLASLLYCQLASRTRLKVESSGEHATYYPTCLLKDCPFYSQTIIMLFFVLAIIITLVTAFPPTGGGTCYNIDGSVDRFTTACYYLNTVGASMCCQSDKDCLSAGLCTAAPNGPVGPDDDNKAIWRRSCSDYTWQDPACLAIAPCKCLI